MQDKEEDNITTHRFGFKATNLEMKCRDFQYEIGKWYIHEGKIKPCELGFHLCRRIEDIAGYYALSGNRYFIVEYGEHYIEDLDKIVTDKIRFIREINYSLLTEEDKKPLLAKGNEKLLPVSNIKQSSEQLHGQEIINPVNKLGPEHLVYTEYVNLCLFIYLMDNGGLNIGVLNKLIFYGANLTYNEASTLTNNITYASDIINMGMVLSESILLKFYIMYHMDDRIFKSLNSNVDNGIINSIDLSEDDYHLIKYNCHHGNSHILKILIENITPKIDSIELNNLLNKLLLITCRCGNNLQAEYLLSKGADSKYNNHAPMKLATKHNYGNVIYTLKRHGADYNYIKYGADYNYIKHY